MEKHYTDNPQYWKNIQDAFFYMKYTVNDDFIDLKETVHEYLTYFKQEQNLNHWIKRSS